MPTLLDPDRPIHDIELLKQLRGRRLSGRLRTLAVIGAHRFDELPLVNRVFPGLQRIALFEPLAGPLAVLQGLAARDRRITVFPVAVSDRDGVADFHVTSNDGESSSLLHFGSHGELFPQVQVQETIRVPTRRLDAALAEAGLPAPDVLIVDVQGAEHQVLAALPRALLQHVRVIYTEVSTEAVYAGSGLLPQVEALLAWRFDNLGFAPLRPDVPMHGNVLFVARDDVPEALALTPAGRVRAAWQRWRLARRPRRAVAQA
ncbi:MAG: FkbM family methyltransferase [Ideonella sp. WA131b]|jgi:FkbM family methyltransferase|nr:FkbM family methyltransferase [Ideonella sp. WA131b]